MDVAPTGRQGRPHRMHGTLRRAGAVMDLFTPEEPEWGATATAARLGIAKSLAHDVLVSLAEIGLLQRVGRGRYRLGWRLVSLATVLLRTSDLKAKGAPIVHALAERQGAAVRLVTWDRGHLLCIDARRARGCATATAAGPADRTAASSVLLATRPRDEIGALWSAGGLATKHTTLEALERDLLRIRMRGWACDEDDGRWGPRAVAAPVRSPEGDVTAALNLEVAHRFTAGEAEVHARTVVAAASRISAALRQERLPA